MATKVGSGALVTVSTVEGADPKLEQEISELGKKLKSAAEKSIKGSASSSKVVVKAPLACAPGSAAICKAGAGLFVPPGAKLWADAAIDCSVNVTAKVVSDKAPPLIDKSAESSLKATNSAIESVVRKKK
jgi:hypothetical protein